LLSNTIKLDKLNYIRSMIIVLKF